jgi:hypothetical protein
MWVTVPIGLTSALNLSVVLGLSHQNIKKIDNSSSSDEKWEKRRGLVYLVERGSLIESNSFY